MRPDRAVFARGGEQPTTGSLGVGDRLQRCKGFAGNDEQRAARVEATQGGCQIGAIEVGDKMDPQVGLVDCRQSYNFV